MERSLESLIEQKYQFFLKQEVKYSTFYETIRPLEDRIHHDIDSYELRAMAIYTVLNDLFNEDPLDNELIGEAQQLLSEQIKQRDENSSSE